ncbi:MAG: HD-GYP domain-containing protein [Lachnospiraceae bacterium]|nr:HD-GYP domain-containing protein [Lachnospiraceae bacterium]
MEVKKIITPDLREGMRIAKDVYSDDNHLIVTGGTAVTAKIISNLERYGVPIVSVYVATGQGDTYEEIQRPNLRSHIEAVKNTEEFKKFNHRFLDGVGELKDIMDSVVKRNIEVDEEVLIGEVESIISKSRNSLHMLDMMNSMRDYDDLTYVHMVNVSLLCHIIGESIGMSEGDLRVLTMAGLLHDIGKLKIPESIIKKPDKLSKIEYDIVKKHTILGYQLLKDKKLDNRIKAAALMHHERCDGSGYPAGVTLHKIDFFSRIVAIADVYDAMTADRVYRKGICPFDVISDFEKNGMSQYDPRCLLPFLDKTAMSYINNEVRLSNNAEGKVVMINKYSLSRPIVQVDTTFIDLTKNPNIRISHVV